MTNPLIGVLFHWAGGLCAASFYVPYKRIRRWSWEIYWLIGGIFSWILAPWIFAALRTHDLWSVLSGTPDSVLGWCFFWGLMLGVGGVTFGLTMRYLGLSLGMAVALGLTTVIGTMGPPLYHGTAGQLAATSSGRITFGGIALALIGIVVVAAAGRAKEQELGADAAKVGIAEFSLAKGLPIAVLSGLMSGCFAWGLDAGRAINRLTLAAGTDPLSQGLPVLCVVLAGGFTMNLLWCLYLMLRNGSAGELLDRGPDARLNLGLAALGGTIWYFQFFFYTMGESQMGRYRFSSWTLHMASIILFSTLWGFALKEWMGASRRTRRLVWTGIGLLVGSTVVIGFGNYLAR